MGLEETKRNYLIFPLLMEAASSVLWAWWMFVSLMHKNLLDLLKDLLIYFIVFKIVTFSPYI